MRAIWVGADPGRTTGIVARDGRELLAHRLVEPVADEWPGHGVGPRYLALVVTAMHELRSEVAHANPGRAVRVGVEGVNEPSTHIDGKPRIIAPGPLIAVSIVFGALAAEFPEAVIVPPASHGKGALVTYPASFVSTAERRHGLNRLAGSSSPLRHLRSAWDVCRTAELVGRSRPLAGAGGAR
jgi:hypothetical protein